MSRIDPFTRNDSRQGNNFADVKFVSGKTLQKSFSTNVRTDRRPEGRERKGRNGKEQEERRREGEN